MHEGRVLLGFGPKREGVVGEVVVQVDQPGDDQRTADIDDGRPVRAWRASLASLGDRNDPAVVADPDPPGEDR